MPSELTVHAVQQGPMEFAISDGEHNVIIDYPLPGSDGNLRGMTPSACSSQASPAAAAARWRRFCAVTASR